ncbi:BZ3500_MvSof-1268-A1-R1_Chr5-2g07934 [Microbotryum saponariae]|uniref:L-ornithine N(5)-monooxygenase [NAD(P)H] n=1 Tax=Microbotryum saponariae TaxID=289078 RepID=A0A2X0KMM5_9BASI|nr:BZ3500_MvSof-1268-A1-R1_Chr5-2g07934 [Microbotryum saponariae]SDA05803.1 BZ3501_MvSof-1269-A2-R1_Chr5-2g07756 [Microbotryum saponariae]
MWGCVLLRLPNPSLVMMVTQAVSSSVLVYQDWATSNIQIARRLGLTDVLCYEKSGDIGGTWNHNQYPGAACDIPMSLYSFSFAHPHKLTTQWAGQQEIMRFYFTPLLYLHEVQEKFQVNNICFHHEAKQMRFSRDTGLWTLELKDLKTGQTKTRTCNILISCVGGLSIPNDPTFDTKDFNGDVMHSAQWNHDVSVEDKDVVVVGNGCSAAQIVPEIADKVKSLTQIARSRQSILRRPPVPDGGWMVFMQNYIPGMSYLFRFLVFLLGEYDFKGMDLIRGQKLRQWVSKDLTSYIREVAPKKYWDVLEPNFEVMAKRRVFDSGYYKALHNPKVDLISDDALETVKGDTVTTRGAEAQGRRDRSLHGVQDSRIANDKGEDLATVLGSSNASNYLGTLVAGFPNYFWIMGPNTATGHSSVIFTSECQMGKLIDPTPILKKLKQNRDASPGPIVEVSKQAQDAYMGKLRAEMKKKVWEKDGGVSWYVNKKTGLCTTLYPWSQVHFWRSTAWLSMKDFIYSNY